MLRTSEIERRSRGMSSALARLFAGITGVLGTVAVIAVTLLNVSERTGEIGLRRALGAPAAGRSVATGWKSMTGER